MEKFFLNSSVADEPEALIQKTLSEKFWIECLPHLIIDNQLDSAGLSVPENNSILLKSDANTPGNIFAYCHELWHMVSRKGWDIKSHEDGD